MSPLYLYCVWYVFLYAEAVVRAVPTKTARGEKVLYVVYELQGYIRNMRILRKTGRPFASVLMVVWCLAICVTRSLDRFFSFSLVGQLSSLKMRRIIPDLQGALSAHAVVVCRSPRGSCFGDPRLFV